MKGLHLAEAFYNTCGASMIQTHFPAYEQRIACGLAGEGSECLGFDDVYSQDHDFGAGFCMWLTDEDMLEIGQALQDKYRSIAHMAAGFPRRVESPYGQGRVGVMRSSDYYLRFIGSPTGPQSLAQWRRIPESYLATAVSGRVFRDDLNEFSAIRSHLLSFYPEDLRIKKLVARAAVMGQAGQYNYPRCIKRNEPVAAYLALGEFTKAACSAAYLLNKRYMPFYKWAHRGLAALAIMPELYHLLHSLYTAQDGDEKTSVIEQICCRLIEIFQRQGLTQSHSSFIHDHCKHMMECIQTAELRSLHILEE